jgi:Domain of unknown function (DUF4336)
MEGNLKTFPAAGLQEFGKNIWIADGPDVRDMGVIFTTRMTVVELTDGSVWVESPVPVSFDTLQRITELGPVRYIVTATPRHAWRLDLWHTLFPEAQLWMSRPTPLTLKKEHLPISGILGDVPDQGWANDFDQCVFRGSPLFDEVLFYHKESRTVILGDLIQTHLPAKGEPIRNALLKIEGVAYPHSGVGLDLKLSFTNRALARQSLNKLLSWDFDKLIIAHGPCFEKEAKSFVERAFQWLVH